MRMNRKALNLFVDEDLVKKARNHGLNLSKFLENQLRGYFKFIEDKANDYNPYLTDSNPNINKQSSNTNDKTYSTQNRKSNSLIYDNKATSRVCSLAWIGQRPPEPLTRVQIPADPFIFF